MDASSVFKVTRRARIDLQAIALLLIFWVSRIWQIDSLPLHVDEGIQIRRALVFWMGNPLWHASNGKIIGHWPIALLLPQNEPAFVARIATVLVVLVGFAAGYALIRRLFGRRAALLAALLWIGSPFQMFFERMALMDAETGALGVLAVWAAVELLRHPRLKWAVLTGLIMMAAILFKLTAAPVVATVGFVLLFFGPWPARQRLRPLVQVGVTVAVCAVIPLLLVLPRVFSPSGGGELGTFSTDLSRISVVDNLGAFASSLTGFGTLIWPALLLAGLALLIMLRRKDGIVLVLAPLPLLLAIVALGSAVYLRYFAVVYPLWLILAGAGLGVALNALAQSAVRRGLTAAVAVTMAVGILPFALTSYSDPGHLPLPEFMRLQYLTEHSAGFGLREAALDLPRTIDRPGVPIIASMFADSCRRTNFYAPAGFDLVCGDNLGLAEIQSALQTPGCVYVLADRPPYTGIDVTTLDGQATRVAVYPRPGETSENASITLWLIERQPDASCGH